MLRSRKVGSAAGLYDYLSEGEAVELRSDDSSRIRGEAWGQGSSLMAFEKGRNKGKTLAEVGMNRFAFNSLSKGFSPTRGSRLIQTQDGKHTPGFDHQFSPPKSVSIEAAFNGEKRTDILRAHQKAVRAAFDHMEANAAVCKISVSKPSDLGERLVKHGKRKGEPSRTQGSDTRRVQGQLVAYAATHWTSRPTPETLDRGYGGDPQLHTHVFVFNTAHAEGKWRAVDHRGLVHTVTFAESVYQHQLAYELQKLGYQLEPALDRQGRQSFELAGSLAATRDFFSSRHRQVEGRIRDFEHGAGRNPNRTEMKELTEAFYERTGRMPGSNERAEIARLFNEGHSRPPTELEEQQLARMGRLKKASTEPDWSRYRAALIEARLPMPDHVRGDHFALHRQPLEQRSAAVMNRALRQLSRDQGVFYRHQVEPALRRAAIGHLTPEETNAVVQRVVNSDELVVVRQNGKDRSTDELTTQSWLQQRRQAYEQAHQPSISRPVAIQPPLSERHRPERMAVRRENTRDERSVTHDRQSAEFTPQQPAREPLDRQNGRQQREQNTEPARDRREVIAELERRNVTDIDLRRYYYARWEAMTPNEREHVVSTDARLAARVQPPEPDGVLTRRYWDQATLDRWEKHWSNERSLLEREQQQRAEQDLQRERDDRQSEQQLRGESAEQRKTTMGEDGFELERRIPQQAAMDEVDHFHEVRPLFSHAQQLGKLSNSDGEYDYTRAGEAGEVAFKAAEQKYGAQGVEALAQQYAFSTPASRESDESRLLAELNRRQESNKDRSVAEILAELNGSQQRQEPTTKRSVDDILAELNGKHLHPQKQQSQPNQEVVHQQKESQINELSPWEAGRAVERRDDPATVRYNGNHYLIKPENVAETMKGSYGRQFNIEFTDGRVVTTTNLWYLGTTPEHLRSVLPDNTKRLQDMGIPRHQQRQEPTQTRSVDDILAELNGNDRNEQLRQQQELERRRRL